MPVDNSPYWNCKRNNLDSYEQVFSYWMSVEEKLSSRVLDSVVIVRALRAVSSVVERLVYTQ